MPNTYPAVHPKINFKYCVYLTTYLGNKLPMFYIGSSSVDKVINKNYHGSVSSKKYMDIWKSELSNNPNLFKTKIICRTETREDAFSVELRLHMAMGVVKSEMYINMSLARENGCYGMNNSGEYASFFGKHHTADTIKIMSEKAKIRQDILVADGTHLFQRVVVIALTTARNYKKVEDGTHPWAGNAGTKLNMNRIEAGTHPFAGDLGRAHHTKRFADGHIIY